MNSETWLYRMIHPSWVQRNKVTSQAFRPTPKDKGRLSVYDGSQISAESAYEHYTDSHQAEGVVAVSVAECESLRLPVSPDPRPGFPEHTVIDFTGSSRGATRQKAASLKEAANNRGWLYRRRGSL